MAPSLEKYLFKKYRAVYFDGLSETGTSVNLLDILIKTGSEGILGGRPVLERAGSMVDLGSAESNYLTLERWRMALARFAEQRGDELIGWNSEHAYIEKKVFSAKSLMASLEALPGFAKVGGHFVNAKGLTIRIENAESASFDKDKLLDVVVNDKLWKPNINNGRLRWSSCRSGSLRKLWVVHQVLYTSKLEVINGASVSVGAEGCSLIPATPGLGLEVASASGSASVVSVGKKSKFPGKYMYAFRAVRFDFDAEGNLVTFSNNVGRGMPVTRGNDDDVPYGDEHEQIRELFENPPPASNFEDEDDDVDDDEDDDVDEDEGDKEVDVDVAGGDEEEWDGKPLPILDGA